MARVARYVNTNTVTENGKMVKKETSDSTWTVERTGEPDFIKLYTEAWSPKKSTKDKDGSPAGKKAAAGEDTAQLTLPSAYRCLFVVLAARMSYCDKDDLAHSQLVMTGEPYREEIMEIMGWENRDSLMKGLRALRECNAIRKVSRGCYQINPRFAAKGQWINNPRIPQSDVKGLKKYYDSETREARRKAQGGPHHAWEGEGMPVDDTADNPPAGKGAAALPPETSDDTEYDGRYDDGASTKDSVNFINKTQERSIV